jgi:hypothetical protein
MTPSTTAVAPHAGWFIVSQVKVHRVIYFTDDPNYQPPSEGDWFFVTHYLGDLPDGMTLQNCWLWRCDGQQIRKAEDAPVGDAASRLLDSNRKALQRLLRDLVDAQRGAWAPSCALGETLRAAKRAEAAAYLDARRDGTPLPRSPLLESHAAARGLTLADTAALILERHRAMHEALVESEALRERFGHAIESALTNAELSQLRQQLLARLDVRQLAGLPPPPVPTSSADLQAELDEATRAVEVARLQTQLRYAVNTLRSRIDNGYDHNDGLMKHKAKMAQAVLNNEGSPPAGLDVSMLSNFAGSRNLGLADAARLVLGTVTEAESILRRTEREKDRFLARIDAARTLQDFQNVSHELRAFTHHHGNH